MIHLVIQAWAIKQDQYMVSVRRIQETEGAAGTSHHLKCNFRDVELDCVFYCLYQINKKYYVETNVTQRE